MKRLILLFIVFVLSTSLVSAYTKQDILDNAVFIWYPSVSNEQDNSTYLRTGTDNGGNDHITSTYKLASASGYFDDTLSQPLTFANDGGLQLLNQTVCTWTNTSLNNDFQWMVNTRGSSAGTGDYEFGISGDAGAKDLTVIYFRDSSNAISLSHTLNAYPNGNWELFCLIINITGTTAHAYLVHNETVVTSGSGIHDLGVSNEALGIGGESARTFADGLNGSLDDVVIINLSLSSDDISDHIWNNGNGRKLNFNVSLDETPPHILSYNLTSDGGLGCTTWDTSKSTACTTSDTTPTVKITTDETALCRIGLEDENYSDMNASGECAGNSTTSLTCTLSVQDEIFTETDSLYIGCKDSPRNNENLSSTSGALAVSILSSDLESQGRGAITGGVTRALSGGYTIYTDQKIYARNSADSQSVTLFDKVVTWMNKVWAFNVLTGNETFGSMFNISPVFYVLEFNGATSQELNDSVYQLITDTK